MKAIDKAIGIADAITPVWIMNGRLEEYARLLAKAYKEKDIRRASDLLISLKRYMKAIEAEAKYTDDLGERRAYRQKLDKLKTIYNEYVKKF